MTKKRPKIKKDDKVIVIAGKDKGKIGAVLKVDAAKNRVIVERVNMIKRHLRPNPNTGKGGIMEAEAPIHISNVMLICSKCAKPTRVGKKVMEDGSKLRVCKKCKEVID